jgi:hypothetical protein
LHKEVGNKKTLIQYAEALSSMLTHAENTSVITRVPMSRRGPRLSHLFFADDNLLFVRQIWWSGEGSQKFWKDIQDGSKVKTE